MKRTHKIIMLPTDKSNLYTDCNGNLQITSKEWSQGDLSGCTMQHLYILSDDEIKEGDWCYNPNNDGSVVRYTKYFRITVFKIIATTDPKLNNYIENDKGEGVDEIFPQIPQSLIEYYAKHQPEEVELEYVKVDNDTSATIQGHAPEWVEELKLQDNEVVWVKPEYSHNTRQMNTQEIEDKFDVKLYTREEVEQLLFNLAEHYAMTSTKQEVDDFNKWIKENL